MASPVTPATGARPPAIFAMFPGHILSTGPVTNMRLHAVSPYHRLPRILS